jgi:hypothetical protein
LWRASAAIASLPGVLGAPCGAGASRSNLRGSAGLAGRRACDRDMRLANCCGVSCEPGFSELIETAFAMRTQLLRGSLQQQWHCRPGTSLASAAAISTAARSVRARSVRPDRGTSPGHRFPARVVMRPRNFDTRCSFTVLDARQFHRLDRLAVARSIARKHAALARSDEQDRLALAPARPVRPIAVDVASVS